jgi:hypothetical protein
MRMSREFYYNLNDCVRLAKAPYSGAFEAAGARVNYFDTVRRNTNFTIRERTCTSVAIFTGPASRRHVKIRSLSVRLRAV